jgi:hypothetical protein
MSAQHSPRVLGGARSGKNRYAQSRAEALHDELVFIATVQANDNEMSGSIARGPRWRTIELANVNAVEAGRPRAACGLPHALNEPHRLFRKHSLLRSRRRGSWNVQITPKRSFAAVPTNGNSWS